MKRMTLMFILAALMLALSPIASSVLANSEPDPHAVVDGGHEAAAGDHAAPASTPIAGVNEGIISGVTAIVIFLIVAGIASTMIWPKIVAGLDERNEKIVGEIAAAEDARKQAKESLDEYEKSLANARAEAQQMIEETRASQGALAAQLKATADTELSAMREKAISEIESAKKQALNELYNESVNLATVMAGKILAREVTVDDQQKLMDESLAEMKSVNC
jgi:F-type H+-transporting ATPase subunit b